MRTLIVTLGAALLLSAAPIEGQSRIPRRAFVPAVTPWLGVAGFGQRLTVPSARFRYGTSAMIGVTGDMPLSRRTALLGTVGVAPSRQRGEFVGDARTSGDVVQLFEAELGLAARLRPSVPVFFYAGGGVLRASRYAAPGVTGSAVEPRGTLAVGYDTQQSGRLSIRALAGAHFARPGAPAADSARLGNPPSSFPLTVKSGAVDWSVRVGVRYALRARDGELR